MNKQLKYWLSQTTERQVFLNVPSQEATFPCVSYFLVSEQPKHDQAGLSAESYAHYQISIWSEDFADLVSITGTIKSGLDGLSGSFGEQGDTVNILPPTLNNISDIDDPSDVADDGHLYHRVLDYYFWYL